MEFEVIGDDELEDIYFERLKELPSLKKCNNHMEQLIEVKKIIKEKKRMKIPWDLIFGLIKYYDWIYYAYKILETQI